MAGDLVIITPEVTPGSGGLADYTLRIVEQWVHLAPRFIVPAASAAASPNVRPLDPGARVIRELSSDDHVLLQYSAYGFHRLGFPRALLRALVEWKSRGRGRLVIMFHEIWTFWPILNKNYPLQWMHRREIAKVLAAADAVFTSTGSQAAHLRSLSHGCDVQLLPVGSNIRVVASKSRPRGDSAVLFGLQASRIAALQRVRGDLQRLAEQGRIRKLVTAGDGNTPGGTERERELARTLPLRDGAEMRGALPEDQISALLSESAFGISMQDELSVTKSGSFMAYAAHGLNILSPHARPDRTEPLCWATRAEELEQGLSQDELDARRNALRAWQERTCSWPQIARRLADALQLPSGAANPAGAS